MALKVLDRFFVRFGCMPGTEGPQVLASSSLRVLLARVQTILAGLKFSNHEGRTPPQSWRGEIGCTPPIPLIPPARNSLFWRAPAKMPISLAVSASPESCAIFHLSAYLLDDSPVHTGFAVLYRYVGPPMAELWRFPVRRRARPWVRKSKRGAPDQRLLPRLEQSGQTFRWHKSLHPIPWPHSLLRVCRTDY